MVQLYAHDPVASVTRPVAQLVGFARVELAPGERATVTFSVPTTRLAFTGRDLRRIVEPGRIELFAGRSCATRLVEAALTLVGEPHPIGVESARVTEVDVRRE